MARLHARRSGKLAAFFVMAAVATALTATPAWAADVDGTWTGSVSTPGGDFPVSFTFKADGAMLTGTMLGMDGAAIPIENGMIEGSMIAFGVTLDFGGAPFVLSYTGDVSPTEILLKGDAGGMPFELTVTKQQ